MRIIGNFNFRTYGRKVPNGSLLNISKSKQRSDVKKGFRISYLICLTLKFYLGILQRKKKITKSICKIIQKRTPVSKQTKKHSKDLQKQCKVSQQTNASKQMTNTSVITRNYNIEKICGKTLWRMNLSTQIGGSEQKIIFKLFLL